jgi:hypothetical protein
MPILPRSRLMETKMAYQIAAHEVTGALYVVCVADGRIVRICRECDDRADADQLLRDLSGWKF